MTNSNKSFEAMQAELEALRKENDSLRSKRKERTLTVKANVEGDKAKGTISVYGLGRFPITLYRSQWEKLLAFVPQVQQCIETHKTQLDTFEGNRVIHRQEQKEARIATPGEAMLGEVAEEVETDAA